MRLRLLVKAGADTRSHTVSAATVVILWGLPSKEQFESIRVSGDTMFFRLSCGQCATVAV